MFEIKTTVEIPASITDVWNCLIDTGNYSTWNSFIRKIEGKFEENNQLKIEMIFPDNKKMLFTPLCIKVKKEQEIRWVGKFFSNWLFRGEHYFLLERIGHNTTKLIHAEKFTGLLTGFFKKQRGEITRQAFEIMNKNLSDSFCKIK